MADAAHKWTDKKIKELERRLNKEYEQAIEEIEETTADYFRRFEIKDKKWQQWVDEGKKTEEEYQQWRFGQMAVGDRWEEMKETLAADYHKVNERAKELTRDAQLDVYSENFNYSTYEIEKGTGVDTNFTLYNKEAVEQILMEDPELLPQPGKKVSSRIAAGLDVAWNKQVVQSVVIQGIMQGLSIPKLATKLADSVGEKNRKSAIRNARTAMTGAQNAARVESYKRAQGMGIDLMQEWVATLDGRTRHEHRLLDGQRVKVGQPFEVEGNTIRFPGDPQALPRLVYNCRCTLISQIKGFEIDTHRYRQDPDLEGMTYKEWKEAKRSKSDPITKQEEISKHQRDAFIDQYRNGIPAKATNEPTKNIRYGKYRGISFDDEDLREHVGDGSELDPIKMIMDDTGFSSDRAKTALNDITSWTVGPYGKIRARSDEYSQVADRIEEFIDASPKYKGTIYRGIAVEAEDCLKILDDFEKVGYIDQQGISSWSTDIDYAKEFANMKSRKKVAPMRIVFQIDENETGVSIKHLAAADNDEVIQSQKIRYEKVGDFERVKDPEIGDYCLIKVREVYD